MGARLVSDQPKLLIDVGNTQLKYTWFESTDLISDLQSTTIELESWPSLLAGKPQVLLCSVKSHDLTVAIVNQLKLAKLDYRIAETQAEAFGIQNSYQTVTNMGSDRWMAMLGADLLVNNDVLVVDAGTAITCDFIVNKQHLGGWIAPGLGMLRRTVVSNTQRVFDFSDTKAQLSPGKDTANCVANGAMAQIIGMIMQAAAIMQTHSAQFSIVLTGGDRNTIQNQLPENQLDIIVHNNLVLAGLARLSLKNNI